MCNVNGGYSVNQYLFVRPGDCHLMCIACFLGETDEGWHDWQKFLMPYNLYLFNIEQACTFMVVTFSCKIGIWPISSVLRVPFLYNGTSVPYWCIVTICFLLENWKFGCVIKFPSILKRCWRQLNSLLFKGMVDICLHGTIWSSSELASWDARFTASCCNVACMERRWNRILILGCQLLWKGNSS